MNMAYQSRYFPGHKPSLNLTSESALVHVTISGSGFFFLSAIWKLCAMSDGRYVLEKFATPGASLYLAGYSDVRTVTFEVSF